VRCKSIIKSFPVTSRANKKLRLEVDKKHCATSTKTLKHEVKLSIPRCRHHRRKLNQRQKCFIEHTPCFFTLNYIVLEMEQQKIKALKFYFQRQIYFAPSELLPLLLSPPFTRVARPHKSDNQRNETKSNLRRERSTSQKKLRIDNFVKIISSFSFC
jgi:hypothetical protein